MAYLWIRINFDRFKCCNPIVLASIFIGILDMTICIPGSAFISISKMSNETWTEKNQVTSTIILAYSIASTAIGLFSISFMTHFPYTQTAMTVTSRVFSIVLLSIITSQINVTSSWLIWLAIMVGGLIQIVLEVMSLCHDKKNMEEGFYTIYMKSWLSAIAFTGFSSIIVGSVLLPRFATANFQLIFFILYTLGLEMMATATYFVEAIQMATGKRANTSADDELVKNIEMNEIPDKVGRTSILSQLIV